MVTDENGRINKELVTEEMIAEVTARVLTLDETFMKNLANEDRGFVQRVIDAVKEFFDKVIGRYKGENPGKMSPEIKEAVKMLEGERAKILGAYNNMLKATQKEQGHWIKGAESGSVMRSNSKKSSVAKNRNKGYNENNWKPDLSKKRLKELYQRIQRNIEKGNNYVTDNVKWLFTNIDGEKVFALYSTVYPDNPTLIYESKGLQAIFEKDYLLDLLEDIEHGKSIDKESELIDEILVRKGMQQFGDNSYNKRTLGGRENNRDGEVLQKKSRRKPRPAFISSLEYIYGIQPKTGILKSKPDTGTAFTDSDSAPLGRLEIDVEAQKRIDEAVKKYGAMKKGVAPTRDVTLPKRTEDDRYVRQTTRTAIESDRISDEVAKELVEAIANNDEWTTYREGLFLSDAEQVERFINDNSGNA